VDIVIQSNGLMTSSASGNTSPPDWQQIDEEICCPLCSYILRGLTVARCPECGYRFEWPELLDPTRRLHPYLFEHHPEQNVRSFRRTLLGGLRPWRFWTSLHPAQPSCPRRLIRYWLLAASFLVAVPLASIIPTVVVVAQRNARFQTRHQANSARILSNPHGQAIVAEYGSLQAYLDAVVPTDAMGLIRIVFQDRERLAPAVLLPCVVPFAWPWLTFVVLMVFDASMRHARVDRMHVLRCVLYSFDVVLWFGLGQVLLIFYAYAFLGARTSLPSEIPWLLESRMILAGTLFLVAFVRLWIAYRRYLRFHLAFATVLASQVIVVLSITLLLTLHLLVVQKILVAG